MTFLHHLALLQFEMQVHVGLWRLVIDHGLGISHLQRIDEQCVLEENISLARLWQ